MNQTIRLLLIAASFLSLTSQVARGSGIANGPEVTFSQPEISISTLYGFVFQETFRTEYGNVRLHQGPSYGINLGIRTAAWSEYEIGWRRQVTVADADIYYYNGFNSIVDYQTTGELAMDYFTVGMNGMNDISDRATVFGGLSAGLVVFTPQNRNFEPIARFAIALKGGIRAFLTDNIGIRLQPELYVPLQSVGADVFISSGGSGVGVSGYSTMTQFGGSAGLTVKF